MTATRQGRSVSSAPRRVVSFGSFDGRATLRGFHFVNREPLLYVERDARALVRLDFDRALGAEEALAGMGLARRGCEASLVWQERSAVLAVWGTRPWASFNDDYGHALEQFDGVEVRAHMPAGDAIVWRCYVRAPLRDRGGTDALWSSSAVGVTDMRSGSIGDPALAGFPLDDALKALSVDGQIYRVATLGELGEEFTT